MKAHMLIFLYTRLVRPVFFLIDPERIHNIMLSFGSFLGTFSFTRKMVALLFSYSNPILKQRIAGIDFENPVGLSAGFDKNGEILDIAPSVGFGYTQVGTVTWHSYKGNEGSRLVRLKKSQGLVVNYGLKNDGIHIIEKRISSRFQKKFPIGLSIGKTNSVETSEIDSGIEDYALSLRYAIDTGCADFYTINISCPNILQVNHFIEPAPLRLLLEQLFQLTPQKPLFIKMPIHLSWEAFNELLIVITSFNVAGVVIGNLAKDRTCDTIKDVIDENQKGGISGKPTEQKCNELISKTYATYGDTLIIVGAGGIFSAEDAYEKIRRGASLVQLITGMVYQGPGLISSINSELAAKLKNDGLDSISEAIGLYNKKK